VTLTTPKPRRDGRCVVCREPYTITPRPGLNPAVYVDPFCSSRCARSYFGTSTETDSKKGKG
jgi:hypothetical protein